MRPPPRPPIICYDLQTSSNARKVSCARHRVPPVSVGRGKTKVTVVKRDHDELDCCMSHLCGQNHSTTTTHSTPDSGFAQQNPDSLENYSPPASRFRRPTSYNLRTSSHELVEAEPYLQNRNPFVTSIKVPATNKNTKLTNHEVRFAYSQKVKHDAEERERNKEQARLKQAQLAKLDEVLYELEKLKRVREDLEKTYGMSHNAARYLQQQDEYAIKQKQKLEQYAKTRSRELEQRQQQIKRFRELQQKEEEEKVEESKRREREKEKAISRSIRSKHLLSSTLNDSQTITNIQNSNVSSSSSTISISSCSSSISTDEGLPSIHFIESPTSSSSRTSSRALHTTCRTTRGPTPYSLPSPSPSFTSDHLLSTTQHNKQLSPQCFSFYKPDPKLADDIIELDETEFFAQVEDHSVLKVKQLVQQVQSKQQDLDKLLQSYR